MASHFKQLSSLSYKVLLLPVPLKGDCLPIKDLLTFSLISFLFSLVLNPLAHLDEQNLPDPYSPLCSSSQFTFCI